jgi:hypothetical protein
MRGYEALVWFGLVGVFVCVCCVPVGAFGVSGGRVYELVSPVYKGGFGALHIEGVAGDGDSVAFYSPGAFAGTPCGPEVVDYVARRDGLEWSTSSLPQ